jgi:hypothetical protein
LRRENEKMTVNDSMDKETESGVVVNSHGSIEKIDDPTQWPSGEFLRDVLIKEGVLSSDNQRDALFWQRSAQRALLQAYGFLPEKAGDDDAVVVEKWKKLATEGPDHELVEFLSTATSNGRRLKWDVMHCPSGTQFRLHAHPNLELIACCRGNLHEIRMTGEPITKTFETEQKDDETTTKGPSLSGLSRPWTFGTLSEGQWLVNPVGSIHKSFTATSGDGCVLLTLWSGCHANIDDGPVTPDVGEIVKTMDQRLESCGCSSGKQWESIAETFLPESEKKQQVGSKR